jgi:hypothetical protein
VVDNKPELHWDFMGFLRWLMGFNEDKSHRDIEGKFPPVSSNMARKIR